MVLFACPPMLGDRSLLLFLIVAVLFFVSSVAHAKNVGSGESDDLWELQDDNFDRIVFAEGLGQSQRSWLVFFFAPWCAHCKTLLPQFANCSRILRDSGLPHSRLAVVNAVKNKGLASLFGIDTYPTLIYTTGKGKHWNKFYGGFSVDSFFQFAIYLQRGAEVGSFADVVSYPLRFQQVEEQVNNTRVPMFVWVPARGENNAVERRAELLGAQWNLALDAAASVGNVRFGVVYDDDVPGDWATRGNALYVAVVETARRCRATGPDGEVFIVASDAFKTPHCYEEGPWLARVYDKGENDSSSLLTELHPLFEAFLINYSFRAVEELTPGFFSVLSGFNHHYLGLIVTSGPLPQTDLTMMPVLRKVVQERNEARVSFAATKAGVTADTTPKGRISLAHADGTSYSLLLTRYRIEAEKLPAILVVDPRREKVYRLCHHTPRFEVIKHQRPWPIDGEQQKIIASFFDDVEHWRVVGEKMTTIGVVAEYLLYVPGMEFVYETLAYEDTLFVVVVFGFVFFFSLLFVACVVDPTVGSQQTAREKKD